MAAKTNYEVNGKKYYRVSETFGRDSNGKLIRKYFYGNNKKEAEKKLEEYKFSLRNGVVKSSDMYMAQTLKIWLFEFIRNNIKPSCFDKYECTFRNYIETAPFKSLNIKDITGLEIQRYYNNLFDSGKSTDTIKRINKLLKRFFVYCVAEGFMFRNPCSNIIIPKKIEIKKEIEVFTKEELTKMITFEYDQPIKYISLVALSTGMRIGEVLGLKWEDLDFNSMEINITRTLTCYIEIKNGERHVKKEVHPPKTKNSIRTIPLPVSIAPILEKARKKQLLNEINLGDLYNKDNKNHIFLTKSGNFYHKAWVTKAWGDFLKKCNVDHKRFHALRHTYATLQFENDVPLKTVSSLLGHSSINITADVYTHVLKKEKEKAMDIINVLNMC